MSCTPRRLPACLRFLFAGLLVSLLLTPPTQAQQADKGLPTTATVYTLSEVNDLLRDIELHMILQTEVALSEGLGLFGTDLFAPLRTYLDLNVLGAGQTLTLHPQALLTFIQQRLAEGQDAGALARALVDEFRHIGVGPARHTTQTADAEPGIRMGGFFVGEFEYHQEPDGARIPLLEINQVRVHLASRLNPGSPRNNVSVLAEWNPVPEEIIHQIDAITLPSGAVVAAPTPEIEGLIPFERLNARVDNVAGSGLYLTVGQFRNPFGLWSDYTSHRNFSSTKNNMLVNGFALKKIELGLLAGGDYGNGVAWEAAVVHGRQARTSPLDRVDPDDAKDFVGHLSLSQGRFRVGTSAYLGGFGFDNTAFGVDWLATTERLTLSGEVIYQRNTTPSHTFDAPLGVASLAALGAYAQFSYALDTRLHLYGFYETWRYHTDGDLLDAPTYKVFHGLRFQVTPQVRWMVVEYGRMLHAGFDHGHFHLATQLEVTF